ncbi:MAG: hypothetical protein H7Y09_04450 [Chitinophagaceae bacterium]|nr:hypothetical protein [Anaerolineae bacterium]
MSNVTNQDLSKAFDLIEQDRLSEARSMLEPLLASNRDNADVWWIYAYAVDDPVKAHEALDNVLRIDPAYPGATDLQETLRQLNAGAQFSDDFDEFDLDEVPTPAASRKLTSLTDDEFDFDDLDTSSDNKVSQLDDDDLDIEGLFDDDDLDQDDYVKVQANEGASRRGTILAIAFAALIVLLLVFVFVIINPFGGEDEQDATIVPTNIAQSNQVTAESVLGGTVPTVTSEGTEASSVVVETPSLEPTLEQLTETGNATAAVLPEPTTFEENLSTETLAPATAAPTIDLVSTSAATDTVSTDDSGILELATATATEPTRTPLPTPTNTLLPPTVAVTLDAEANFDALYAALSTLEVIEGSAAIEDTTLGQTLLVSVCSQSGAALRDTLSQAMYTFARESRIFTSDADFIGVRLINCVDSSILNVIGVDINDAIGFSDGNLSQEEFRGRWRAIG